ncbi:MAG: hemolysin D, partial [Planctomycetota bacterium]
LEIPNLRQKSTEVLKRWFQKTCLGLELQDDPFLPTRGRFLFGMFTIASVIYRWVVVFSICWFVIKVLEPYGLQAIGRLVAVIGFAGLVGQPIIQTWKFCRTPGRLSKVKRTPLLITLGTVGAVIAAVCFIPLPHHVDCAFEVRPSEAGAVYAGTTGRIEWTVEPQQLVAEGDEIAILENPDLAIRLADLKGQEQIAEVELNTLSYRSRNEAALVAQLDTQTKLLKSIRELRAKTEEELERLTVRATRDGYVIPPPSRAPQDTNDGRLPGWTGSPLNAKNRGALLTADDVICEIGEPDAFEAVLIIDQGDVQLVRVDQVVDMKLDSRRMESFSGVITERSTEPMQSASMSMSSQTGGDLQTEIDPATGAIKPRNVSYQARVPLSAEEVPLRPGYRGSAKIHVDPMSLGSRLWRVIAKTFNFEL